MKRNDFSQESYYMGLIHGRIAATGEFIKTSSCILDAIKNEEVTQPIEVINHFGETIDDLINLNTKENAAVAQKLIKEEYGVHIREEHVREFIKDNK